MPTKLFASMGFPLCATVFLLIIVVMYLSKKKFKTISNNIFLFLLVQDLLLLINEFLYIIAMYAELDGHFTFLPTRPLCYSYIFLSILFFTMLIMYIWIIWKNAKKEVPTKKELWLMTILMFIVDVVMISISFILKVDYPMTKANLYIFGGTATSTIYVIGIFVLLIVIIGLIRAGKTIPAHQKNPIYFALLGLISIVSVQIGFDYDYNTLTFVYTLIVITLYFTTESQDYKLIDDLEKKKEEAQLADRAQREFLSNMSHEIRTPLNTILGFSNSLLSEKKLTKEIVDRDVSMIQDASTTLLQLINNILDISRIESGKEKVEEKDYKLDNLVFEIDSSMLAKIDKNMVTFKINVDKNIPSSYHGDYIKIYKVLMCILNNALKYSNYGQITLDINGNKIDNDTFEFNYTISNEGHEMTDENFKVDFNDFVELKAGSQNIVDATALGLILSKKLLEMLGGTIDFANKKGEGTKYFVKVKQTITDPNPVGEIYLNKNKDSDTTHIDCTGKKVLVVDDNNLNLKLANRLLTSYNFDIDTATSGKECIEKVEKNKYDIVFLDHMMPEMDGITTLKLLKKTDIELPKIIALTANSYTGIKEKYLEDGFDNFLAKPISVKELNKVIYEVFKEE